MIVGCSAVLFGVLAVPLLALGTIELPSLDFFGGDNESRTTSTTLAPLPAAQCAVLRSLRETGNAAFDATFDEGPARDWATDRTSTDAVLTRYEFALQSARPTLPVRFSDDLRQVAELVHDGRAILATSGTRREYRDRVTPDVTNGFMALTDIEAQLGSACGEGFTFMPHEAIEFVGS